MKPFRDWSPSSRIIAITLIAIITVTGLGSIFYGAYLLIDGVLKVNDDSALTNGTTISNQSITERYFGQNYSTTLSPIRDNSNYTKLFQPPEGYQPVINSTKQIVDEAKDIVNQGIAAARNRTGEVRSEGVSGFNQLKNLTSDAVPNYAQLRNSSLVGGGATKVTDLFNGRNESNVYSEMKPLIGKFVNGTTEISITKDIWKKRTSGWKNREYDDTDNSKYLEFQNDQPHDSDYHNSGNNFQQKVPLPQRIDGGNSGLSKSNATDSQLGPIPIVKNRLNEPAELIGNNWDTQQQPRNEEAGIISLLVRKIQDHEHEIFHSIDEAIENNSVVDVEGLEENGLLNVHEYASDLIERYSPSIQHKIKLRFDYLFNPEYYSRRINGEFILNAPFLPNLQLPVHSPIQPNTQSLDHSPIQPNTQSLDHSPIQPVTESFDDTQIHPDHPYHSGHPDHPEYWALSSLSLNLEDRIYDLDMMRKYPQLLDKISIPMGPVLFNVLNPISTSCIDKPTRGIVNNEIIVSGCPTEYLNHINNDKRAFTFSQVAVQMENKTDVFKQGTSLLIDGFNFEGSEEYEALTNFLTTNSKLIKSIKFTNCTFPYQGHEMLDIKNIEDIEWIVFEKSEMHHNLPDYLKSIKPIRSTMILDRIKVDDPFIR